ncbi:MAG: hypothetical protein M5T52_04170 [Ignavibacteriaceae bacterium]|nr:hypothetical protein [Ignavibacteriaceae bacterium]
MITKQSKILAGNNLFIFIFMLILVLDFVEIPLLGFITKTFSCFFLLHTIFYPTKRTIQTDGY